MFSQPPAVAQPLHTIHLNKMVLTEAGPRRSWVHASPLTRPHCIHALQDCPACGHVRCKTQEASMNRQTVLVPKHAPGWQVSEHGVFLV